MGIFDKISGKERRLRLINRNETARLKRKQKESRQLMIFRHNQERADLQKLFKQMHERQRQERSPLAGRIFEFRQIQDRNRERKQSISRKFERASSYKSPEKSKGGRNIKEPTKKWDRKRPTRTRSRIPKY